MSSLHGCQVLEFFRLTDGNEDPRRRRSRTPIRPSRVEPRPQPLGSSGAKGGAVLRKDSPVSLDRRSHFRLVPLLIRAPAIAWGTLRRSSRLRGLGRSLKPSAPLDWQKGGLIRPQCVTKATEEYLSDQDAFSQWLDDCCSTQYGNRGCRQAPAQLLESCKSYASACGVNTWSPNEFGVTMKKLFGKPKQSIGKNYYIGVRLKETGEKR